MCIFQCQHYLLLHLPQKILFTSKGVVLYLGKFILFNEIIYFGRERNPPGEVREPDPYW